MNSEQEMLLTAIIGSCPHCLLVIFRALVAECAEIIVIQWVKRWIEKDDVARGHSTAAALGHHSVVRRHFTKVRPSIASDAWAFAFPAAALQARRTRFVLSCMSGHHLELRAL